MVDHLFEEVELKFAWAVDKCIQRVHSKSNSYVYVKDLRKVQSVGYPIERILMLDDSPEKIARQPRCHVQIRPFMGDVDDVELQRLCDDLIQRTHGYSWNLSEWFGKLRCEWKMYLSRREWAKSSSTLVMEQRWSVGCLRVTSLSPACISAQLVVASTG